uniref:Suppressor of IKBKE 1 n=1 Tax=Hippocampus comes TaxID=109280 RepID=A0A3Q2XGT1_HIPCM
MDGPNYGYKAKMHGVFMLSMGQPLEATSKTQGIGFSSKFMIVSRCARLSSQHADDTSEIQEMIKYKPHVLLTQENTQIKELQQENKELWLSLEEHQYTLELIMGRYRKHMLQMMMAKEEVDTKPVLTLHEDHAKEVQTQVERICEMGQVMRRAMQVDDQRYCSIREKLAQLEIENKELRDLLAISKDSMAAAREESTQPATATHQNKPQPESSDLM